MGVDKPDDVRKRLAELNDEITRLGQEFSTNIRGDVREVTLAPAALAGMPEDFVEQHPVCDYGKIHVNTTYPDYQPFMQYAKSAEARRKLYLGSDLFSGAGSHPRRPPPEIGQRIRPRQQPDRR
jgi:thimet oligopeptidase